MNALRKSPVLNRQCLRNKIEELSPLLIKQLNLGMSNKDMLFRATWSYYASGCQERLTSIRRRIEQNAKIVAPTGGPRTYLCKNLNISLPEITLPPGVDLEDHIYREFVSCFRSEDQSSSRPKNPPKRFTVKKELNSIQYSSPEQWKLWKREERKVRQILMQSKDPYRSEELTEKLKKLRKLTNRHPLIELPSPPEEPIKSSLKKIKRRSSIKPLKQPEVITKSGPYVNRSSKDAIKTAPEAARLRKRSSKSTSKSSKSSLIKPEIKHSSSRKSINISKSYDTVSERFNSKNEILPKTPKNLSKAQLSNDENPKATRTSFKSEFLKMLQSFEFKEEDNVENQTDKQKDPGLPIDSLFFLPLKAKESKSSRSSLKIQFSKMFPVSEFKDKGENRRGELKIHDLPSVKSQEKYQKSKSSRSSFKNEFSKMFPVFESKDQAENLKGKLKNPDLPNVKSQEKSQESKSSRSSFKNEFSKMFPVSEFKQDKVENHTNHSLLFLPDRAKEKKQESTPTTSILKKKSSKMSQVLEFREEEEKSHVKVQKKKNKLKKASLPIDSLLIIPHKLQEKPKEPKPSRINLRKKSSKVSQVSENSKNKFAVKVKIRIRREKPQIPEKQTLPKEISITNKENIENPHVEKLSTSSDPVLVKPGYKPHKVSNSFQPKSLRQAHSWHSPRGRIKTATQVTNMKDKHRIRRRSHESHRLESIRKSHSWHSPKPDEKYIPFKADRSRRKFDNTPYGFDLVSEENQETKAEVKSKFQYDWPLPIAMRHMEYFKPYGQLKIDGLETNQVQRFPEVCLTERRKSSMLKPLDLLAPPEIRIPFLDSEFKVIKQTDNLSLLFGRTYSASRESNEDLKVPPPIILSDIIMECMNEYGSEVSFRDTDFMKPNKLDIYCPEITIKKPRPKIASRGEIKEKKSRKKGSKKLQKMPSKRVAPPCSLCNLVRRRQSELRPYMKRMQMQRQRLELQTYYTQKILKERRCQEQDSQEARIARKRQVLARCYQVLKLCQDLLELRLLQRSQKCQS
ncbi:uncharacterized protein LOC110177924 [Drosophila serrata]|uniref:uncharacterized protein LOC110177924 n=1 Tax=Drosophila serrata TaxID=7274 RepID=UPI000A1D25FA|nr:uncharacterized protein LOC110177924 [Drosophila serrata]